MQSTEQGTRPSCAGERSVVLTRHQSGLSWHRSRTSTVCPRRTVSSLLLLAMKSCMTTVSSQPPESWERETEAVVKDTGVWPTENVQHLPEVQYMIVIVCMTNSPCHCPMCFEKCGMPARWCPVDCCLHPDCPNPPHPYETQIIPGPCKKCICFSQTRVYIFTFVPCVAWLRLLWEDEWVP